MYIFFMLRPPAGYVAGTVLNSLTKEPLVGEAVFVEDGGGPGVRIHADGSFFLRTPSGKRALTLPGEDYDTQPLSLSVESRQNSPLGRSLWSPSMGSSTENSPTPSPRD
jgi:hypothetical protein